jgi:uncharacterized metal-binding protein
MAAYDEPETLRMMQTAAQVELEGYCRWTRVREIMEFARRMGYTHLGIATCVGLIRESRILAEILRSNGFTVTGIGCKVGAIPKVSMGIDPVCAEIGPNLCNPVLQAALLTEARTELNIVMGLCVGHDSLFYRHSEAPVTTLVTKDRVLGHNPVAALYTAGSYYSSLKGDT